MDPGRRQLLETCEKLIETLRQHGEHAKLQALLEDIETFRARLLEEQAAEERGKGSRRQPRFGGRS
jgi:ribosomal 50S subunit-associated protein YjgA (DUF615 family)